ncbi:hypothetical protein GCM10007079_33050 [Nocardiopsis terrae]|uniref:DUF5753 domain-containing protein n=1 Tax=Nocardiopsis terrae TaxID=372655 RepID=A0ABR9HJS4_9ACTN|nr:hypothetical protein [Nocardiopsis terrae]MBE1459120.1 hypothetical protein [Nocardiopsis terrae]GHC88249.1 hypothetical protein GCM10007079_33050 [Nocardiopsis terrae]
MEDIDPRVTYLRDLQTVLSSRQLGSKLATTMHRGNLTPTLCCDPYLGQAAVRVEDDQFTFLGVTESRVRVPVTEPAECVNRLVRERAGLVPSPQSA